MKINFLKRLTMNADIAMNSNKINVTYPNGLTLDIGQKKDKYAISVRQGEKVVIPDEGISFDSDQVRLMCYKIERL